VSRTGFAFSLEVVREHSDEILFMADATASDWARILGYGQPRDFVEGEQIVREGESDRALYFLTEGSVRLMGAGLFKTIDAPSVLGEIAFLDGQPRSSALWGASDGQIVRFDRDAYEALSAEDPELGRRMALDLGRVTALRLRMAQQARQ
jgi:CRP/FNR family cyclic AMP-dependent transcriptional regulator